MYFNHVCPQVLNKDIAQQTWSNQFNSFGQLIIDIYETKNLCTPLVIPYFQTLTVYCFMAWWELWAFINAWYFDNMVHSVLVVYHLRKKRTWFWIVQWTGGNTRFRFTISVSDWLTGKTINALYLTNYYKNFQRISFSDILEVKDCCSV